MSAGEGISNHPQDVEAAEQAKLKQGQAQGEKLRTVKRDTLDADDDLPKGMAEKVETVEVSTMTPHK